MVSVRGDLDRLERGDEVNMEEEAVRKAGRRPLQPRKSMEGHCTRKFARRRCLYCHLHLNLLKTIWISGLYIHRQFMCNLLQQQQKTKTVLGPFKKQVV